MMFLVAEVHPFLDGNGRIARAMMNADLVAAGETRILIPSVYRNEYIGGLKRLTNHHEAYALVRVLDQAQRFVHSIVFGDFDTARVTLEASNAFKDPADDTRLIMPANVA